MSIPTKSMKRFKSKITVFTSLGFTEYVKRFKSKLMALTYMRSLKFRMSGRYYNIRGRSMNETIMTIFCTVRGKKILRGAIACSSIRTTTIRIRIRTSSERGIPKCSNLFNS